MKQPPQFWEDWAKQPNSRDYLRKWFGRVTLDTATDLSMACSLGTYLYDTMDWTGDQDPCFLHVDSPVNNLQDHDAFMKANGFSPAWSCGPLSCTMTGLLALHIKARQVKTSDAAGRVDNALEFWASELEKWVLYIPHLGGYFFDHGQPLSLLEWANFDRIGVRPHFIGPGKPRCVPDAIMCWAGMSRDPRVMCGNGPYAGITGPNGTDPIPPEAWMFMPVLPMPPGHHPDEHCLEYGTFDAALISSAPASKL